MYPRIRTKWSQRNDEELELNKMDVSPLSDDDETIYSRKMREMLVEEDGLQYREEAFMDGYQEALDFVEDEDWLELDEGEEW